MPWKRLALVLVVALLAGVGCRTAAMDTERTLSAAGFQMKFANTAEQKAQAASLPQRTLTPVPHDGDVRYVYADGKYCHCVYVGSQEAYGRYQKIAIKREIADEQLEASMNWGVWGGWGPWW